MTAPRQFPNRGSIEIYGEPLGDQHVYQMSEHLDSGVLLKVFECRNEAFQYARRAAQHYGCRLSYPLPFLIHDGEAE